MRNTMRRLRLLGALVIGVILLIPATASSAQPAAQIAATDLEFLGEHTVATGTLFGGTEIGGLSSISYDARRNVYYAISDDQGNRATGDPVRFYTVAVDFDLSSPADPEVTFLDVTQLYDSHMQPFLPGGVDPEGLVYNGRSQFYISSEGIASDPIVDPFIRRYNAHGNPTARFPIPDKYIPNGVDWGVRQNLSLESLNLTPDGRDLVTAGEGALYQDGPASSFSNGSLARILIYDVNRRLPVGEYVYEVDPWAEPSAIFGVNGIVEVLPLDNMGSMLVMERSFSVGGVLGNGTGNVIKLYEVSTQGATDVLDVDALYDNGQPIEFTPVSKELLFEFDDLGFPIDNVEGMTFGPDLADGRRSIVIVSDNNFAPTQFTQFFVFALDAG